MGKSQKNRCQELETEFRTGTWAMRIYLERLLSSCRAPLITRDITERWAGTRNEISWDLWYVCRPSARVLSPCAFDLGSGCRPSARVVSPCAFDLWSVCRPSPRVVSPYERETQPVGTGDTQITDLTIWTRTLVQPKVNSSPSLVSNCSPNNRPLRVNPIQ